MPGTTGMLPPCTPIFASASRLGVCAVSNSVLPPGDIGRPPKPSATSMTILLLFFVCNSRVSGWMSIAKEIGGEGNGSINHLSYQIGHSRQAGYVSAPLPAITDRGFMEVLSPTLD